MPALGFSFRIGAPPPRTWSIVGGPYGRESSDDPLFISLLVVVGFGMILTGTSYALDRRRAA
jgi:putative exporter of polyketide antibiotics